MISYLFKAVGQATRELVDLTQEVVGDIANIPSALSEGYEEGLFPKEDKENKEAKTSEKKEHNPNPFTLAQT